MFFCSIEMYVAVVLYSALAVASTRDRARKTTLNARDDDAHVMVRMRITFMGPRLLDEAYSNVDEGRESQSAIVYILTKPPRSRAFS